MEYKIIYNHTYDEIVKYRAKNYFGEWKTNHFLFNIINHSGDEVINQYFDPLGFIAIFGCLYSDQTIVVEVKQSDKSSFNTVYNSDFLSLALTYHFIIYTKKEVSYSYFLWVKINMFSPYDITSTYEVRKQSQAVFRYDGRTKEYTVQFDAPELGYYKPCAIPSKCLDCQYYSRDNFLRCAVNPYQGPEVIYSCNDYQKKI